MIKKIFLTSLFILLISCGFKPMLKGFDSSKITIKNVNYIGKNELTYLLNTSLGLTEQKNSNGLIIKLTISEDLISLSKNTSGVTTEEDLIITVNLDIKNSELTNLSSDTIIEKKRLVVTNNLGTDDTTKNIERNKLIQNISQKIKFKLLILSDISK